MHVAIITAGGAGMFCGSCMHDNTWARALLADGVEVSLIPTYTPLRVDEQNASLNRVFLGGINVYLNSKLRWWHRMPRLLTSWLDRPGVIQLATKGAVSNDAKELGELAISILNGEHGAHREAIDELANFLKNDLRPDVIIFSNALLSGALAAIKQACPVPVLCTLQGDDVFLESLPVDYRQRAIDLVSRNARQFDGFLTHTRFYRDDISQYLHLPVERFSVLPLGIDTAEHTGLPQFGGTEPYRIGYFARFAPEKGLHHLIDAMELLRQRIPNVELRIGGYQGPPHDAYLKQMLERLSRSGISYKNIGSPGSVQEKVAFLGSVDVFSVPTDFLEPKGMSILEAMANGVPVVQPAHGAFPEMIQATGGGRLVEPKNAQALADALAELADPVLRSQLAQQAWAGVREHYDSRQLADRTLDIIRPLLPRGLQ